MQSEAVLCAPRLSLQYQSALCISNHIFGRMSIKPLPLFAFSFIFSFSPGAALLCCCRLHIILCLRVPQRCILAVGSQTVQYPTVNDNVDLEFLSTPHCKVRNSSYEFAIFSKNKIPRDFRETQSLKNGLNRRF